MLQTLWKTIWHNTENLNINLSYDLEILLLRIYPREMKKYVHTRLVYTCYGNIFKVVNNVKQSIIQLVNGLKNVVHSYHGILFNDKKA